MRELRGIGYNLSDIRSALNALRHSLGHDIEFFVGSERELIRRFIDVVENADEFIMCTGGVSRQREYLRVIEKRVREKSDLVYLRVFPKGEISEVFYEHLQNILGSENAEVKMLQEETPIAYVLCTEDTAIVGLPGPGKFRTFIRTDVPIVVESIKMYVQRLAAKSVSLERKEDLDKLIRESMIRIVK